MDEQLWRFIDATGTWISSSYGMTRMTGRVLGWLLVCDPVEQTAAQLSAALDASAGRSAAPPDPWSAPDWWTGCTSAASGPTAFASGPRPGMSRSVTRASVRSGRCSPRGSRRSPALRRSGGRGWRSSTPSTRGGNHGCPPCGRNGGITNGPRWEADVTDGTPPAIEARGLGMTFGTVTALDGLDLQVAAGTVFGLLGPNGAGKTTLVRILSTLLRPTVGTAAVLGHDVVTDALAVRRRIGLAGQSAGRRRRADRAGEPRDDRPALPAPGTRRRASAPLTRSSASGSPTRPTAACRPTRAACAGGWTWARACRGAAGAAARRADHRP